MIEIVDIFCHGKFFVVEAEHFHNNGTFWYMEHYQFLASEGNKQKRATSEDGKLLMDDNEIAPSRDDVQYLPSGKKWGLRTGPHMDESSIWKAIISDHKRRKSHRFSGGRNQLSPSKVTQNVRQIQRGGKALMARFQSIVGDAVA